MADRVDYCDVAVTRVSAAELLEDIKRTIGQQRTLVATYMHLHTVNLVSANARIRDTLARFDTVIPDGIAVLWSSRLFGTPFSRRTIVTTYEIIMPTLIEEAIRRGWSFFLFGGEPGVAARAKETLAEAFPGIRVVGTHHGYIHSSQEDEAVVACISRAKPTILLVGLGQPKQEEWILRYRHQLNANVIFAVGGYFDKVAKSASIYPHWVKRSQLYWFYRLLTERKRVWKRYTVGVAFFAWNVLRVRFRRRAVSLGPGT